MWAGYHKKGHKHILFYGFWNFKNDFVGSGDPGDASGIAVRGFKVKCWRNVSDQAISKEYNGKPHRRLDTREVGKHRKSVRRINDKTRDHKLYSDNGIHQIDMKRVAHKKGCKRKKAGSYFFEHNQDGRGGWSASISLGFLSLSYGGASGTTLKKGTKYDYR